jgi:hypothetical protein
MKSGLFGLLKNKEVQSYTKTEDKATEKNPKEEGSETGSKQVVSNSKAEEVDTEKNPNQSKIMCKLSTVGLIRGIFHLLSRVEKTNSFEYVE